MAFKHYLYEKFREMADVLFRNTIDHIKKVGNPFYQ